MARKKYAVKLQTVSSCGSWDSEDVRDLYGENPEDALESAYWEIAYGMWSPPEGCQVLVSLAPKVRV